MNIGVLGTGMVGQTIASKLVQLGHAVKMGSRSATNDKAASWVASSAPNASQGTNADASAFGGLIFNCIAGMASLDALRSVGSKILSGKLLVDVANPLDFSHGMPPSLSVCNTDSLGEQIQRAFPDTRVVKALNTVNCRIMVNPALVPGDHDLLICGNDADAKATVTGILKNGFGWNSVVDLGDISAARAMEMYLLLWLRLYGAFQSPDINIKVAH